ncbi:MAG: hydrogenase maturation nickel metallochaperone HypA [Magnetococcales bacterium]|nr:hydrogenase maturation nickel metallochaperone HypA [Magnetococcales bacterium]
MHELSLAMAMVEQLQEILAREQVHKLLSVTVAVGALSGVDRGAFAFSFPLVVEGTPLAGVRLLIEETPLRLRCQECGEVSQPEEICLLHCAACASGRVEILSGQDFVIRSLEVQ